MISMLIAIFVIAIVGYVLFWLIGYLAPPEPIRKVCIVLLVLFGLIMVLNAIGFVGTPFYRGRWGEAAGGSGAYIAGVLVEKVLRKVYG